MKQTQQETLAQSLQSGLTRNAVGPQQSPAASTSAYGHPFAAVSSNSARVGIVSAQRKAMSQNGLPDSLRNGIETMSGISMGQVKVHYNSPKPAGINAHAYTQGSNIYVAPGQEEHLAHEAWHVVQQAQGRVLPTVQMKGDISLNDDKSLELEADVMGREALGIGARVMQKKNEVAKEISVRMPQYKTVKTISSHPLSNVLQAVLVNKNDGCGAQTLTKEEEAVFEADKKENPDDWEYNEEKKAWKLLRPSFKKKKSELATPAMPVPTPTSAPPVIRRLPRISVTPATSAPTSMSTATSAPISIPIAAPTSTTIATPEPASTATVTSVPISTLIATSAPTSATTATSAPTSATPTIRRLPRISVKPAMSAPISTTTVTSGPTGSSATPVTPISASTSTRKRRRRASSSGSAISSLGFSARSGSDVLEWSRGHGTGFDDGSIGVKENKTILTLSGAESVEEHWDQREYGGEIKGGSGQTEIYFVRRRSNPSQYRAVGIKINHKRVYPMGLDDDALKFASEMGLEVVDEPWSPLPSPSDPEYEE